MTSPPRPLKLGILVPSSNTVLEPLTNAIIATLSPPSSTTFSLPPVTAHYARFPVTEISLTPSALSQFDTNGAILSAARLLGDAHPDIIGWSGTSGGWLGFEADERLCAGIMQAVHGVPATTSTLALNRALGLLGARRIALVTPYVDKVQARIIQVYAAAGYEVVAESHLGVSVNVRIAEVDEATLERQVAEVVEKGREEVQAVITFCTNLAAAHLVEGWEARYGVPVLDTVATVVWDMLRMKGVEKGAVKGWGRLFEL